MKVKSISLLALLAVNGSAYGSFKADEILQSICQIDEGLSNSVIPNYISSSQILSEIEDGKISDEEIENICSFLKKQQEKINTDKPNIKKNGGWCEF
jgi:hypothetical protein